MQNEDIFYSELIKQDYTDHNLQVIKHCKEQADQAVAAHTNVSDYPYLNTPHFPVVRGVGAWNALDYFLEAATHTLFEGITARWITYQGAPILELHGKNTILTAKHVLTKEEKITESKNGYRKNRQIENQKNQLLLKELEEPNSEDTKPNIVLVHGDGFAHLRIFIGESDVPELTTNIMLMPSLDAAPETEFITKPMPVLNPKKAVSEPEVSPELLLKKKTNDYSQS